jgi:hypothetical protein
VTLVAGIDVGNATTEIVVADVSTSPPTPLLWDRARTRGPKGSAAAIAGAIDLLHRMERTASLRADVLVMAPQHPVQTQGAVLEDHAPDTGRLVVLTAGRATPAGHGTGVGRPVAVDAPPDPSLGPVVLVAPDPLGFRVTSDRVNAWVDAGCDVVGILLSGDEAVLVARRVQRPLPVVDQADTRAALVCTLVAVEVGDPGRPVRRLTDPVHLAAALGLGEQEHAQAEALARSVRGLGDLAVGLLPHAPVPSTATAPRAWMEDDAGRRTDLLDALGSGDPRLRPSVRRLGLPDGTGALSQRDVDDLWAVDLSALGDDAVLRPGIVSTRSVALATLTTSRSDDVADQSRYAATRAGRAVLSIARESDAARAGALTTPAARRDAVVVDIGGGTVDVVLPDGSAHVLAGAGDLVTTATSLLLQIPGSQAEWAKRGPCARVEGPHVVVEEDGTRRFLEKPAATGSVGWLVVPGPAGPLPFDRALTPAEWRSLRIRLKRGVLGGNIARGGADQVTGDVLVVGGPAGDDEVLECVARALPRSVPGRGDVAGRLGHRWAVAFGLVVLMADGATFTRTEPDA